MLRTCCTPTLASRRTTHNPRNPHTLDAHNTSNKREPIGAVPSRGYTLPEGLGATTPFGVPLHVAEQEARNATKDVIFPPAPEEAAGTARMYARTHGSYAPGARRGGGRTACRAPALFDGTELPCSAAS